jgi:predicted heme/steroid binding protein
MFKWFDERFHIVEGVRDHLQEDELGIAKREVEEVPTPKEKVEVKAEVPTEKLKPFTVEELHNFDGTGGKPIYIAYQGKVYDLSKSALFQGEKRMRCHIAGKDLTKDMDVAPHGEDLIFKFPLVGRLK